MNLHEAQPTQTRYVRAAVVRDQPLMEGDDPCEWDSWIKGYECRTNIAWAIVDTQDGGISLHGIEGACVGHLCNEHIDEAFAETISGGEM